LQVIEAKLIKDTEIIGKMDPFLILEYTGKKYRTKVHQGGGKHPKWGEFIEIRNIKSKGDLIKITCYDEDIIRDDLIGTQTC
jgi:Ca2+-dependent lipid-binding protein